MFALLLLLLGSAVPLSPADADLAFLSGDWRQCTPDGVVEERWLGPREGLAVGANLTLRKGKASFEHLRIAREAEGWTYWASPAGKAAVPFRLVAYAPGRVEFENKAHDFPTRIVYARDGDALVARIEGTIGGAERQQSWRFERGTAADCDRR